MTTSNHDQDPIPDERITFAHQEIVQYNDGELALVFRTPGDVLTLGHDSTFEYARHLHSKDTGDMAIISTKSGDTYGIGQRMVIDSRKRKAYSLPDELPEIEVGKSWSIPDVLQTSDIQEVQFIYETGPQGHGEVQVDKPSPFPELRAQLELARRRMTELGYFFLIN